MSRKRDNSRETVYHEIHIFRHGSDVPKTLDEGKIMVDAKAFYIGKNGNWRIRWKNVEDVTFDGRNSLSIKCADEDIECENNSTADFCLFLDYVQKIWNKKQGKSEARMETVSTHRPAKKCRTYGRNARSFSKPRLSMAQPDNFSSDDEKDDPFQKKSWTSPEEPEEVPSPSADEEEEDAMDAESPDGHDEHETLVHENKRKRTKGKRRLQRKAIDNDDDDSDDDVFNGRDVTTPAAKRLVSPANADDSDEEIQAPAANLAPSTKGNQSIMNFFNPRNGSTKTMAKPEKKKLEASSFSKTPPSTPKRSLKQDNSEWLENTASATPSLRRKKISTPKMGDSDIDSINSARSLPRNLQSEFFGNKEGPGDEVDDPLVVSPPTANGPRHRTSGVDRRRFGPKHHRIKSLMQARSEWNKADEVLAMHTPSSRTPNWVRRKVNPYSYHDRENIKPNEVSRPKSPWRGLRNLGNTCYLNSSLQMLCSVPTFVSSLAGKGKDLTKSIVSVSEDIKDTTSTRAANPNTVKKAVDAVTDKFEGYEQRDAHEFLSDLVDRVHDELEEERKESGTETTDDTPPFPTDEFFRMNVQVCLTCDSCGYTRTMEEMYRHLSIDVEDENKAATVASQDKKPAPWSIQKGIDQFFAPETREIKCEKCEDGTTATQTLRILSRPKALLLHLKRFALVEKPKLQVKLSDSKEDSPTKDDDQPKRTTAVEMAIRKNKARVVLDSSVSLGPVVPSDENKENDGKDDRMATYDVKSVAHHIGSTAWSGHYTCDAIRKSDSMGTSPSKQQSDKWVSFDDGMTSATTADNVLKSEKSQKTAYMLLYTLHQ